MNFLSAIYPPLEARTPLPKSYTPLLFSLFTIAFILPRRKSSSSTSSSTALRAAAILPIYAYLLLIRPYHTAGGAPADDYNDSTLYLAYPLAFLDHGILSPCENRAARWIGRSSASASASAAASSSSSSPLQQHGSGKYGKPATTTTTGKGEEDCGSVWERAKWAFHLCCSPRGIGWDWRVKNVPSNPLEAAGRWEFVRRNLLLAVWFAGLKTLSVYGLGFTTVAMELTTTDYHGLVWSVVRAWICGCWGYQTLAMPFHLLAATTVAIGVSEPWEWPPLFGRLREGWSVRQMWSVVWHQNLRRTVQQPGIRLSRLLGLAKGTLASKYFQLYMAFAISMLYHQWNIFNAVREDVGECRFFMSQAVAITIEDFVQWCWRKVSGRTEKDELTAFEKVVGWVWTFAWFSYSLPEWASGMLRARILGHGPETAWALALGRQNASKLFVG